MIAVCGIGSPSGCRNSAETANQSAKAPTIAASANARTYPTQPWASSCQRAMKKTTDTKTKSNVARIFIFRSARRRSRSAADITSTAATLPARGQPPIGAEPDRTAAVRLNNGLQTAAIKSATSALVRNLRMILSRVGPRLPTGLPLIELICR